MMIANAAPPIPAISKNKWNKNAFNKTGHNKMSATAIYGGEFMEVKFKRESLSLNISWWAGIVTTSLLAKWIYEPNVSI